MCSVQLSIVTMPAASLDPTPVAFHDAVELNVPAQVAFVVASTGLVHVPIVSVHACCVVPHVSNKQTFSRQQTPVSGNIFWADTTAQIPSRFGLFGSATLQQPLHPPPLAVEHVVITSLAVQVATPAQTERSTADSSAPTWVKSSPFLASGHTL
jgi:hypothetical protein